MDGDMQEVETVVRAYRKFENFRVEILLILQ